MEVIPFLFGKSERIVTNGAIKRSYCGDGAYEKALAQGQAIYNTGWREAETESTISIRQLGVGMEFKFPQDWFEPPFTEFVLVSKEELSDDEWKIVFDPLVKKGVSDIEATISSDTRFVLLQEMDYGYESTDDDDYLPDFLRAEYQPDQTLSDYSPEQLTESSAIEGYQPLKYSVVGNRAEETCRVHLLRKIQHLIAKIKNPPTKTTITAQDPVDESE